MRNQLVLTLLLLFANVTFSQHTIIYVDQKVEVCLWDKVNLVGTDCREMDNDGYFVLNNKYLHLIGQKTNSSYEIEEMYLDGNVYAIQAVYGANKKRYYILIEPEKYIKIYSVQDGVTFLIQYTVSKNDIKKISQ